MPDTMTREQRSRCMARIRATDTRPEMVVRKSLHAAGFRYSLHRRNLPGSPDIVLPKYHSVVFVNGCFWHNHPGCRYATRPRANVEFWEDKLINNKERDMKNVALLEAQGWNVITVWECELKKATREETLTRLVETLRAAAEPERFAPVPKAVRKMSKEEA